MVQIIARRLCGGLTLPAASLLQPAEQGPLSYRTSTRRTVTVRDDVLKAAQKLAIDSADGSFTVGEVIDEARRQGSTYKESTIRTHVTSRICVDAPDNHAVTYPDLLRVDHGRYRLV